MRLQDYDTSHRFDATVLSSERITPEESADEVREIVLELECGDLELVPGQSLGILAPGQKEFGQKHHLRLYTVADVPRKPTPQRLRFPICVRRCTYVDEYSGEEYPGVASNYLCDRTAGDRITLTGPYGLPFDVPSERNAHLILIGAGTGIAPFRAFVKHLHQPATCFEGRITLFHGAKSGLELLYRNDRLDDFALYYDQGTFEAIEAFSARPHWGDDIDWGSVLAARSEELWRQLGQPTTYVYVAGLEKIRDQLDAAFAAIAGSKEEWWQRKTELQASRRWVELLY